MKAVSVRHKHLQLDQAKLDRARRIWGAKTETEALDRALNIVVERHRGVKPCFLVCLDEMLS